MKRYAAFLRGVMPYNCKMAELRKALEKAGFEDVRTLLASGNVVLGAKTASEAALEKKLEAAMEQHMGRTFMTIVRSVDDLRALLDANPFTGARLAPGAKHVVTFLRAAPQTKLALPIELDGAKMLAQRGREVFTAYWPGRPGPRGPTFMGLIERTLGKIQTTRSWQTIEKAAK